MNRRNFLKIAGLSFPIAAVMPKSLFSKNETQPSTDELTNPPENTDPFVRYPIYGGVVHTKQLSDKEAIELLKNVKGEVVKLVAPNILLDYRDSKATAVIDGVDKTVKRLFSYPNYDVYNSRTPRYERTRTYYFEVVETEQEVPKSRPRFRKVVRY